VRDHSATREFERRRPHDAARRLPPGDDDRRDRGDGRRERPLRAAGILTAVVLALAALGCGGQAGHGRLRVTSLSLSAANGFPGPPSFKVTIDHGTRFERLARLVRLPLPPQATSRPPNLAHPDRATICFPMDLAIGLSNGASVVYPSCSRPRSLLRVLRALCPLVKRPGFCALYRDEL